LELGFSDIVVDERRPASDKPPALRTLKALKAVRHVGANCQRDDDDDDDE
jgi:hypothetical protein